MNITKIGSIHEAALKKARQQKPLPLLAVLHKADIQPFSAEWNEAHKWQMQARYTYPRNRIEVAAIRRFNKNPKAFMVITFASFATAFISLATLAVSALLGLGVGLGSLLKMANCFYECPLWWFPANIFTMFVFAGTVWLFIYLACTLPGFTVVDWETEPIARDSEIIPPHIRELMVKIDYYAEEAGLREVSYSIERPVNRSLPDPIIGIKYKGEKYDFAYWE